MLLTGGKGNCLGFAPRSESFAFELASSTSLNPLAIRTNSLNSCRPSANPLNLLARLHLAGVPQLPKPRNANKKGMTSIPFLLAAVRGIEPLFGE